MSWITVDTETSGVLVKGKRVTEPGQPRIVSIGAIVFDEDGTEMQSLYSIIRPEGFTIPDDAVHIHGISTARAMQFGISFDVVYPLVVSMMDMVDRIYFFNENFDRTMFDIECALRYSGRNSCFTDNQERCRCLMLHMAQMMKLPGQYGDYRWPKLEAAYAWYFSQPMPPGAHNAMVDARYTGWLASALHKNGEEPK